MTEEVFDTIIIGGGVAGLGAAVYCGRFQMKTLILTEKKGGTIILTKDIGNYPGFKNITGMELAKKLEEHVKEYGVEIQTGKVTKVESDKVEGNCFKVFVGEKSFLTKTIIFATGTEWKKLKVPGEEEFTAKGVHYCALCDGAIYKDKVIGVVGGSDSAAKEALLLTEYGKKVFIIYRKEEIRAEPINYERVKENKKIEIINNTNVVEIKGNKTVTGIVLDKPYNGSKEFKLDALFVEIGHIPLSNLAKDLGLDLNDKHEIKVDRDSKTNINGVFAAGDVVDTRFKQAITGVGEGVQAAFSAYQYINNNKLTSAPSN
ncbi:MAG: hypothetical protein CL943_03965 [Candidatus Diapherotrites archaeon]|uniref:FAD/NAD(P)-binding domain-containing protein n=1 Tax=Candidatus Iainarchaeum sp. TaxID=3101447 RepID=A0A2D6M1V8_9ARCH|nr:hypothetical protein [Candidatus Diapherotrites archaeon]